MMETIEKKCTKCNKIYSATTEYFQRDSHGKNGLRARCKACCNKRGKGGTRRCVVKAMPQEKDKSAMKNTVLGGIIWKAKLLLKSLIKN